MSGDLQYQETPADPRGYLPKHPPETIEDLDLPVRPFNIFKREGIHKITALTMMCERDLLDLRSFGVKDLASVKEALERHGLRLRPEPTEPFTDVIEVEHVTVYRWGNIQVTVNGAGEGLLSTREFSAVEMQALCSIFAQITEAERSAQETELADGSTDG
jgi:hypothetical protein